MVAHMRQRRISSSSMARSRRRIASSSSLHVVTMLVAAMAAAMALLSSGTAVVSVEAFATSSTSFAVPRGAPPAPRCNRDHHDRRRPFRRAAPSRPPYTSPTSLAFGDSGILGVGTPELAVILLVGYFVLGPSDLYKLVKEIGKFVQNLRSLGDEAAKQFEGTMEDQLDLTELRKAQAELNDAFSFRRSINTMDQEEAFDRNSFVENANAAATEGAGAAAGAAAVAVAEGGAEEGAEGAPPTKKKRRLVRRKKKKAVEEIAVPSEELATEYPDLDMLDADLTDAELEEQRFKEEKLRNQLRAERLDRLNSEEGEADVAAPPDWFTAPEEDVAAQVLDQGPNPAVAAFEDNRFQSQMSAEAWNSQIMENEDELAPLSMVMKRLAILEEEKNAADRLLEEEYQKRTDNEDKYYLEKRRVLEDAITEIQEGVYSKKEVDEEAQSQITDTVVGGDEEKEEGTQAGVHSKADDTDTSPLEKEKGADKEEEGKEEEDVVPKSEEGGKKEMVEESNATTFSV